MDINARMLDSLAPISQFNKGQAAQVFDRLKNESQLVVLKNNVPTAVILSPEEFKRLAELEEDYYLLTLAQYRLDHSDGTTLSEAEVMAELGITEQDIENAEELEIE